MPRSARILNEHFVSIKVDREERPDLDQIYMTAVQTADRPGRLADVGVPDARPAAVLRRHLLPARRPLRPARLQARPAARSPTPGATQRADIDEAGRGRSPRPSAGRRAGSKPSAGDLDAALLRQAGDGAEPGFDPLHGGFGSGAQVSAPDGPASAAARLRSASATPTPCDMVRHTLDHMAMGGIYDHLGGGFHRYSTDARWLVPHFEKMLYDNALLALAYLEALPGHRRAVLSARSSRRRWPTSLAR